MSDTIKDYYDAVRAMDEAQVKKLEAQRKLDKATRRYSEAIKVKDKAEKALKAELGKGAKAIQDLADMAQSERQQTDMMVQPFVGSAGGGLIQAAEIELPPQFEEPS